MKTSTTFLEWTKDRFEEIARVRTWSVLRGLDGGLLRRAGIAPELLEKGPDAWPWQAGNDAHWSSADRPIARSAIERSEAPTSIESTDRLDAGESPDRARPSELGPRHLAA